MQIHRRRFKKLVMEALEELPREFRERLDNVVVVVEDWPSPGQLAGVGLRSRMELMGLYEGVPLPERSRDSAWSTPDKISIFRMPIQMRCNTEEEIKEEVKVTVRHEIAHHFGIDDQRLEILEEEQERED